VIAPFADSSGPACADDAAAGWDVARQACVHATAALGDRLVSVYAIGSLAHGGFALAVSDVDIALLVDHCDESVPGVVGAIVESAREELGPGLADRLSIFYGDWNSFGAPPPTARLGAIDRLDLMDNGVLMSGIDRRPTDGARPSREEVIAETAEFLRHWLTRRRGAEELIAAGPRELTKNVLFPVRFLYTHATGRAGSNHDAINWYDEQGGPHAPLAIAALRWRSGDIDPVAAHRLLERHLDGLYTECRDVYGCAIRGS
jgi:hypothetical protein